MIVWLWSPDFSHEEWVLVTSSGSSWFICRRCSGWIVSASASDKLSLIMCHSLSRLRSWRYIKYMLPDNEGSSFLSPLMWDNSWFRYNVSRFVQLCCRVRFRLRLQSRWFGDKDLQRATPSLYLISPMFCTKLWTPHGLGSGRWKAPVPCGNVMVEFPMEDPEFLLQEAGEEGWEF